MSDGSPGIAQVTLARATDWFVAASGLGSHPIHIFPMDAWAASLAEGAQDAQKRIIFREILASRSRSGCRVSGRGGIAPDAGIGVPDNL